MRISYDHENQISMVHAAKKGLKQGLSIDLSEKLWCRRDSNPGPLGLAETLTVRSAKTVKKIAEWSEACCREALKWPYLG